MGFDEKRREFISLLGSATIAWPATSFAQSPERTRRIGVLMAYAEDDPNGQIQIDAFRERLRTLGWSEGGNITIDVRYAKDNAARVREAAADLLRQKPDLMVSNSNLVTTVVQTKVRAIPLVFISVSDPVGSGFVKDLARPGGTITGFANFQLSMGSKWLEKLHEIAPQVARVGLLLHPEPPNFGYLQSAQEAAPSLNVKLIDLKVHDRAEIESTLADFAGESRTGLIVAPNFVSFANSALIVALAARYRLPSIYPFAFFAREGGLISYGFDERDQFRQGAAYVDKILRGAQPSDLPVQYPTKFEIVINLKTAKALGLEVPSHVLQLADDLVE
jgi:putative ABC transport system substrate-binding protein